jgi:energy-coupling factor transporter ATP-binding protein EcfA2
MIKQTYSPYDSLDALMVENENLTTRFLKSQGATGGRLLNDVEVFVEKARLTGAKLEDELDRNDAQSALSYWITILFRAGRDEVSGSLLLPFDVSQAPVLKDDRCPYIGLRAFRFSDSTFYAGREETVKRVIESLKKQRVLFIVGSSGSGKSSLVMAGVLPKLRKGGMEGSDKWRYFVPFAPGGNPFRSLARSLTGASGKATSEWSSLAGETENSVETALRSGKSDLRTLLGDSEPAVIVVDQLEELFTQCETSEVEKFLSQLVSLVAPGSPHLLLLTMRIEYREQISPYPAFQKLYDEAHLSPSMLSSEEIREVILGPAKKVGLQFDDGIVDDLVAKVSGYPSALPLLQFALREMWQNKRRTRVTWDSYNKVGDPLHALEWYAEGIYESFIEQDQPIVNRILLQMVLPGPYGETISRRVTRLKLNEFGLPERVDLILDRLVASELIRRTKGPTTDEDEYEVAHEALPRNWPRLYLLVDQQRGTQKERIAVAAQAKLFQQKPDPNLLLSGTLLETAEKFQDLASFEWEFVKESRRVANEAERRRKRGVAASGALSMLALVLLLWALYEIWQEQKAADGLKIQTQVNQGLLKQKTTEETRAKDALTELKKLRLQIQNAINPMLPVSGTSIQADGRWAFLKQKKALAADLPSVCRLDFTMPDNSVRQLSGFVVAPNMVMTLEDWGSVGKQIFGKRYMELGELPFAPGVTVFANFEDDPSINFSKTYKVIEKYGSLKDIAVTLYKVDVRKSKLPPALKLLTLDNEKELVGRRVCAVGYPAKEGLSPLVAQIALGPNRKVEIKRASPGLIRTIDDKHVYYDCFTNAGNNGSPVIDVETGLVVAMHLNALVYEISLKQPYKNGAPLWRLTDTPLFKKAGITAVPLP